MDKAPKRHRGRLSAPPGCAACRGSGSPLEASNSSRGVSGRAVWSLKHGFGFEGFPSAGMSLHQLMLLEASLSLSHYLSLSPGLSRGQVAAELKRHPTAKNPKTN